MSDKSLADLRKSYELGSLEDHEVSGEPLQQFRQWFSEALARKVPEPNAMTVATVGEDGRPSTRVVLIKDFDESGIVWYTNYASRKGRELACHPYAALQFHWVELERVVRIEGDVEKVAPEDSDAYFESRPLAHRIGAWASHQSEVIPNRGVIVARAAEYGLRFGLKPPRPPHWGGYRLRPHYWEFWQGRASRLHDRIAYRELPDGSWVRERLSP
ncbi:pyridoxamine 5'-phosphate oxidase [Rhodocyclaceae bacterium SMB388]